MPSLIESTSEYLSGWRPGHRAWFWLCPELDDSAPLLLLSPMGDDPASLRETAAALALPDGAQPCAGIASADGAGRISLGGPALSDTHLARLARWVRYNRDEHPGLSRLKDVVLIRTEGGRVAGRVEDSALWADIPDARVPGSLDETVRRLGRLKAGMNFWFWMTARGPSGAPHLLLEVQRRDPDGRILVRNANEQRLARGGDAAPECGGILRQTEDGSIVLTTEAPLREALDILSALVEAHPSIAEHLAEARVVRTEGDRFREVGRLSRVDLSRQSALLQELPDEPLWFWFTDRSGVDGAPLLLLETSRDALKATAKAAGGGERTLRGQVAASRNGWLEFRTRDPWPNFIAELARWAAAHHTRWPDLARLRGARMTQRDRDGQILDRQKDSDAWSAALG